MGVIEGVIMTSTRTSHCPLLLLVFLALSFTPTPTQAIRFLGTSSTYARYPKWHACQNASLSFEFKTRQPSAMLVYTDDNGRYDFLQVALTKGAVRLSITFVAEENRYVEIEATKEALNDNAWHRVEIRRNRMETVLFVDGTQTSKVALGSDSDLGLDVFERNNHVYFGGIPNNYAKELPEKFTNEKFRGELRNILYFNCSCIPVRAGMEMGSGVDESNPEACERNNPCPADCPCVSADDGSGCACNYKRECRKSEFLC
ncbi:neurexin 1-like [Babylonia areolata]|uniref:neurexin 1-like n=1 Tax=Babylonia areolata TaxID=304850 RepID=UPI003FD05EA2